MRCSKDVGSRLSLSSLVSLSSASSSAGSPSEPTCAAAARGSTQKRNCQHLQIAQSLKTSLKQFQPNICLLNQDQFLRHACDIAVAADWMKACYNMQQNFTWALAGFNVLLSFLPQRQKDPELCERSRG